MEKTNIRYVTHEEVPEDIAFSSIDVAFISLTKVLLPVKNLLGERGHFPGKLMIACSIICTLYALISPLILLAWLFGDSGAE